MSSICGIVDLSAPLVDFETVRDMGRAMILRGRDRSGAYMNRGVVFQHNHMFVSCEDKARQPYTVVRSDGRYTIVLDGEIYGFGDMLDIMGTGAFESSAEAVLECYIAFGCDCVNYFDGEFAFAIYDELHREVFLARDIDGRKPLYYIKDGQKLVFASEIKGLLRYFGEGVEIDKKALFELISAPPSSVSAADIYLNICELDAGCAALKTTLGMQVWRYPNSGNIRKRRDTFGVGKSEVELSAICDDDCNVLYESLYAFDYPEFDEYMFGTFKALEPSVEDKTVCLLDPSFAFGEKYAYMRADRIGSVRGRLIRPIAPERAIKFKHSLLSKTEKKLSLVTEKLLLNEDCMVYKYFGEDILSLLHIGKRQENLIRMYAKLLQSERWIRDYRIIPR